MDIRENESHIFSYETGTKIDNIITKESGSLAASLYNIISSMAIYNSMTVTVPKMRCGFSLDSKYILFTSDVFQVWDIEKQRLIYVTDAAKCFCFARERNLMATFTHYHRLKLISFYGNSLQITHYNTTIPKKNLKNKCLLS